VELLIPNPYPTTTAFPLGKSTHPHYPPLVPFPQYRIPIQRLKEDWSRRIARNVMRRRRQSTSPSNITDNSEPWIQNPSSVEEFWYIACKVNETVAKWAPQPENSSKD
jgi:hypothetical protein